MGSSCSELCAQVRPHTILFSGLLCALEVLLFIYWVQDKYMTVTALLHCIAATLIVLGSLTLFSLYLPHMVSHLSATSKPRKTAAIMILIGGILNFIASILAIANPIYCNYDLCEVHIFVFMIVPFSITIILFLNEFYLVFYGKIRRRIIVYSFILFVSALLFIPYYATTRKSEQENALQTLIFEIIWCIIMINSAILMICVGFHHKKVADSYRRSTESTFNSIPISSSHRDSFTQSTNDAINDAINEDIADTNCFCCTLCSCLCSMQENKRKTMILINCLLLILFGSSTMVSLYFYAANDRYNLFICYYCLIVVISWFIGWDSINYYRDIEYEPITQKYNDDDMQQTEHKQSTNPFDKYRNDEEQEEEEEDVNAYADVHKRDDHRMIIEHNDLDINYNKNNAWGIPPNGYHDNDEQFHDDDRPMY